MDWITEHWTILIGPAVVAAVISSIVTVIGFFYYHARSESDAP
jgi:hypothetical protein